MTELEDAVDIAIVGAGPVGMTLARALADGPYRVLLIDSRRRGAAAGDPRALALSHGTRQVLERLGAWNSTSATAIESIHVSQRGGFGRTLIHAADYGIPALGYVMRYRDLATALDAGIGGSSILSETPLLEVRSGAESATLTLGGHAEPRRLTARLVVHAEGTPGNDSDVQVCDYRQHALVAEVQPVADHRHRAWERFTPQGPLALLPLADAYSVVFTVPPQRAEELLALDDRHFLAALSEQFGTRVRFVGSGPRARFPLALRARRTVTGPRQVWIGNASQSLHPVSGQGFNLGLRDARELAEVIVDHAGTDAGHASVLARYARKRRLDRCGSIAFTDSLVRTFSNDWPALRLARGLGLTALDLLPPLRHFVAKRMIWGARAWP